jgi:hypothetical protein
MKKFIFFPLLLLFGAGTVWLLKADIRVERYTPLFMKRADLEKSVSWENTARPMADPGKIYVRGTELFINEKYKGIHVVDNSDPATPVFRAFIAAPGCIDMAVKGNILYLDNAVDLVAFDLNTKQVTERIRDFLPEHLSPEGRTGGYWDRPEDLILVGWKDNQPSK